MKTKELVRTLYLYGFSLLGLVLMVIGCVRLLDLGLKVYIFKQADNYITYPYASRPVLEKEATAAEVPPREEQDKINEQNTKSQRQNTASSALAMIIIGAPLYWYHWRLVSRSNVDG